MRWFSQEGMGPAATALVVLLAVAVLLRLTWRRILVRGRETGGLNRWLAETTATPVFLLILAGGAQVITGRLGALSPFREWGVTAYLTGTAYILTVLSATWVAYGLLKGFSEWYLATVAPKTESKLEAELVPAIRRVAKLLLVFVAATVVLGHYDVRLTALLGAAGVASLAVALAAQETIANMIAGFTIMVDRPFRLGDRVELSDGRIGDVHEIGLRSTKILSFDNTLYIIPNAELAKSSVINHSYPSGRVNVRQRLSVPYGCDVALVKQILAETCSAHPLALPDPPPQAFLSELGETSLVVRFNFWLEDYRNRQEAADQINMAIYARLEREGIRVSLPREVRLISSQTEGS